jgi:hypothetical protein
VNGSSLRLHRGRLILLCRSEDNFLHITAITADVAPSQGAPADSPLTGEAAQRRAEAAQGSRVAVISLSTQRADSAPITLGETLRLLDQIMWAD